VIAEQETRRAAIERLRHVGGGSRRQFEFPDPGRQDALISFFGALTRRAIPENAAVPAIQIGIAALSDNERAAVQLHHVLGKSIQDAATEMRRTPTAVRGMLQVARESLQRTLELWIERETRQQTFNNWLARPDRNA
jgi:DNA-directed RNA polymerase specialized sigma24 family protein